MGSRKLEEIQNKAFIKCGGVCQEIFHKHCINLGRIESKLLLDTPNLRWFCDVFNNSASILTALMGRLESKINGILKTVSNHTVLLEAQEKKLQDLQPSNLKKYFENIHCTKKN